MPKDTIIMLCKYYINTALTAATLLPIKHIYRILFWNYNILYSNDIENNSLCIKPMQKKIVDQYDWALNRIEQLILHFVIK